MYFWKELDDCKITFITWTFLFWYFIVEYIDRYIFYLFFFKDSYTCEFSKENCTMEQLNSKTIKWVYLKANYRFSKYWNNRIYHVRFSKKWICIDCYTVYPFILAAHNYCEFGLHGILLFWADIIYVKWIHFPSLKFYYIFIGSWLMYLGKNTQSTLRGGRGGKDWDLILTSYTLIF